MININDEGKSFIHKCCQVKSSIILEYLVELYRKTYMNSKKDKSRTSLMKEAKENIRTWVNKTTECDH